MRKDVGVNWASLLPFSFLPPVLRELVVKTIMLAAGYDYVQMLPFRGTCIWAMRLFRIRVKYVEPAWNPTTIRAHLDNQLGAEHMPTTWLDIILFGSPKRSRELYDKIRIAFRAQAIEHGVPVVGGTWVEFHRGMGLDVAEVLARDPKKLPLVLDLKHIRFSRAGRRCRPEAELLVKELEFKLLE